MAFQLIYTSAPRLLEAGQTGFGVVARHREIGAVAARELERASQFTREPGFASNRVRFSHWILNAGSKRFHVLSQVRDAGADYTARTNHIAHHVVIDMKELAELERAGRSPADLVLAIPWRHEWKDEPCWLDAAQELRLVGLPLAPHSHPVTWETITGSANKAYSLTALHRSPATIIKRPGFEAEDTSIIQLFAEALHAVDSSKWQTTFNSEPEPRDERSSFTWIAASRQSPLIDSLRGGRTLFDLNAPESIPETLPPASVEHAPPTHALPNDRVSGKLFAPNPVAASTPHVIGQASHSLEKPLQPRNTATNNPSHFTRTSPKKLKWGRYVLAGFAALLMAGGAVFAYHTYSQQKKMDALEVRLSNGAARLKDFLPANWRPEAWAKVEVSKFIDFVKDGEPNDMIEDYLDNYAKDAENLKIYFEAIGSGADPKKRVADELFGVNRQKWVAASERFLTKKEQFKKDFANLAKDIERINLGQLFNGLNPEEQNALINKFKQIVEAQLADVDKFSEVSENEESLRERFGLSGRVKENQPEAVPVSEKTREEKIEEILKRKNSIEYASGWPRSEEVGILVEGAGSPPLEFESPKLGEIRVSAIGEPFGNQVLRYKDANRQGRFGAKALTDPLVKLESKSEPQRYSVDFRMLEKSSKISLFNEDGELFKDYFLIKARVDAMSPLFGHLKGERADDGNLHAVEHQIFEFWPTLSEGYKFEIHGTKNNVLARYEGDQAAEEARFRIDIKGIIISHDIKQKTNEFAAQIAAGKVEMDEIKRKYPSIDSPKTSKPDKRKDAANKLIEAARERLKIGEVDKNLQEKADGGTLSWDDLVGWVKNDKLKDGKTFIFPRDFVKNFPETADRKETDDRKEENREIYNSAVGDWKKLLEDDGFKKAKSILESQPPAIPDEARDSYNSAKDQIHEGNKQTETLKILSEALQGDLYLVAVKYPIPDGGTIPQTYRILKVKSPK